MKLSYWERRQLEKKRDVLIIGAGIVGLSTAIHIKAYSPDLDVTVLDKSTFGSAATTRNAAFACFGTVSEVAADIKRYGPQEARSLVHMRRNGLKKLLQAYGTKALSYKKYGGYELFRDREVAQEAMDSLAEVNQTIGESLYETRSTPASFRLYEQCIYNPEEAQIDSGELYSCLTNKAHSLGVEIIRGVKATSVDHGSVQISSAQHDDEMLSICAKQVVVATNALTSQFMPSVQVEAVRNQVLITSPIKGLQLRGCHHMDQGYLYFRNVGDDRVLIGGGRQYHPREATHEFGLNRTNITYLVDQLRDHILPEHSIGWTEEQIVDQSWSGILSGGSDRRPILKRIDQHTVVAVKLGGIGVAIGMEIGEQAATHIMDHTFA